MSQLSAIVILPKPGFNLHNCSLPPWPQVFKLISTVPQSFGTLRLPKFSCETRFPNLIPELKTLGVKQIFQFDNNSDFLDMVQRLDTDSPQVGQRVEEIIHAVHVSAFERGTERKTASGRHEEALPSQAIPPAANDRGHFLMTCDKPFQFNVCDEYGLRLLMGEVKNPRVGSITVQSRNAPSSGPPSSTPATSAGGKKRQRPTADEPKSNSGGAGRGKGKGGDGGRGSGPARSRGGPQPTTTTTTTTAPGGPRVVTFNSQGLPTFSAAGISAEGPPPPSPNVTSFTPPNSYPLQVPPSLIPNANSAQKKSIPTSFPPNPLPPRFNSHGLPIFDAEDNTANPPAKRPAPDFSVQGKNDEVVPKLPTFNADGLSAESTIANSQASSIPPVSSLPTFLQSGNATGGNLVNVRSDSSSRTVSEDPVSDAAGGVIVSVKKEGANTVGTPAISPSPSPSTSSASSSVASSSVGGATVDQADVHTKSGGESSGGKVNAPLVGQSHRLLAGVEETASENETNATKDKSPTDQNGTPEQQPLTTTSVEIQQEDAGDQVASTEKVGSANDSK